MKDMRKKGRIQEEDARKANPELGVNLLGGPIKVRKSIISSPLFFLCTAFTLAFDFIPSLEYM
jgi:hypothetical protein